MPFDHNDHYHRLLLRQLPRGCRRALDVGCGTGRFARRMAAHGVAVDAIDASEAVIREAGAARSVRFWQADVTATPLPREHYDAITCLASLHHMPFETIRSLASALTPGGVLLVLGCYREQWPADAGVVLAAVPINAAARLVCHLGDRVRGGARHALAPVSPPEMTFADVRGRAAELLPGSTVRRLLFWRYLLRFRRVVEPG